jgi:hypothetical protein
MEILFGTDQRESWPAPERGAKASHDGGATPRLSAPLASKELAIGYVVAGEKRLWQPERLTEKGS